MRWSHMVFAAALTVPLAAYAQGTANTPSPTNPPGTAVSQDQTSDLDQVICKRLPPPTGTRIGGHTVCQTKKQWLELEQSSQDTLQKAESSCGGRGCGGN
ncbi:MAG: hypothetical protein KGJ79_09240 [Alphaproteobacteria bacterium]|nr:hypothetical protein [Alphaproteobacteria bacterium]MDE2111313.1 hypothetical protein [Alphaproteobacteria bacterium]MDE2495634.1 hypothetical protein [Alphaproteobacteria bacterium]